VLWIVLTGGFLIVSIITGFGTGDLTTEGTIVSYASFLILSGLFLLGSNPLKSEAVTILPTTLGISYYKSLFPICFT